VAAAPPATAPAADVPAAASARVLDDLVAELNGATTAPAVQKPAEAAPDPSPVKAPIPAPAAIEPPTAPVETLAAKALAATAARATAPEAKAPETKAPEAKAPELKPAEPAASSRSFEEVVADMLRPLLEKWIDENMPRIVERALQRDATLGRKPNN
jgi:cell pole-organizing protein PopZ